MKMVGSTFESFLESSDGRPRDRSDSGQPWDERPASNANGTAGKTNNANNSSTMTGDPYNSKYKEEEELEDGDLPRLKLTRSTSNGKDRSGFVGLNASTKTTVHHETLRKMAGGEEELKKQQAFWKQLDSPSTMTNDEDAVAADNGNSKRKRRFEKEKLAAGTVEALVQSNTPPAPLKETPVPNRCRFPEVATEPAEVPDDSRSKEALRNSRKGKSDATTEIWRADSEESENTRDSKEYVEVDNDDSNFCDHTLAAIEVLCGDAGMQAFCGGAPTGAPTASNVEMTIANPNYIRNEPGCRRKQAKNLNILNARDENDSVDEHTAIEVEYVEPEETSGLAQERPENWSPTRKNAYLAAMARKAKEDFERSQTKEGACSPSPKRKSKGGATATEAAAQDVYSRFNAAEKRKFLRLINSGMTPTESAERVHAEHEKSKESKTSKKGHFLKFWKKGKSKNNGNANQNEQQTPTDRNSSGFPLVNSSQQEEKKDDEEHTIISDPRCASPKEESSESASALEDVVGKDPQESQTPSSTQFTHNIRPFGSGSDTYLTPPSKQSTLSIKKIEESNHAEHLHAEKPVAGSAQQLEQAPPKSPSMIASPIDASKPHNPMDVSVSGQMSWHGKDGANSDDGFVKSGLNYYDAVRKDLSESEDEREVSNQVLSKSKQTLGRRLGPILQSPKLQGFSRLAKGGSKATKVIQKYALPPPQLEEVEMSTPYPPETLSIVSAASKLPMLEEEKELSIDDSSIDYSFSKNVNECGTSNFDFLGGSSIKLLNSPIETPTKAEEEALERIEKELLRPVRNTGNRDPSDPMFKSSETDMVTVDLSGCAPAGQSQRTGERLRDQIVAVVSPVKATSTPPGSKLVPPSLQEVTPSKEITPAAASVASTAMLTPLSTQAFCANGSLAHPRSDSMPSPAKLSPILASAAPTYLDTFDHPTNERNANSAEPTQEDLDFAMQDYLNSTEVYSQPNQVYDSMSVVSGRSFITADTGNHEGSVLTQGSTFTQSSRKRRPGAAQKRLAKAKEAEKHAVKINGWHESIRAAAESSNRAWKPKVGWVNYGEPLSEGNTADPSSSVDTEKMHLNLLQGRKCRKDEPGDYRLADDHNKRFQQEEEVVYPSKNVDQDTTFVSDIKPNEDLSMQEHVCHAEHPEMPSVSKQLQTHIRFKSSSKRQQRERKKLDEDKQIPSRNFGGEIKCEEVSTSCKASSVQSHTNSEGRGESNFSKPDPAMHTESLLERAAPLFPKSIDLAPERQLQEAAHLSVGTRFPSVKEKRQEELAPMPVDASCPELDDSCLDVAPATESDCSQSFGSVNTHSHPEKPISLSLEEMSMEESIAHSVDQFVRSIGAASPSESGRRKYASSPNRIQRFSTSPSKKCGWVDSMRAATASIGREQSWDPLTGWALPDSAFGENELSEDFAPVSTRCEQETIEERQTEVSERPDTHTNESAESGEPSHFNQAVNDKESKDQVQRQGMAQDAESTMPKKHAERSLQHLHIGFDDSPTPPPTAVCTGLQWKQEQEGALLDTAGGFPCRSSNMTPTVEVVKEKVDEEEMSWFPRSRRGSSMIVIEEGPEEQANPATTLAGAPGRDDGAGCLQAAEGNGGEGVVLNVVDFESGSHSQRTLPAKKMVAPKAPKLLEGGVSQEEPVAPEIRKTSTSRSGSTISSKNSFFKVVPKLSQNRKDTSPIRTKVEPRKDTQVTRNHDTEQLSPSEASCGHNIEHPVIDVASLMSSSLTSRCPEKNQMISPGEEVRASRSVWRSTASAASLGNSPTCGGVATSLKSSAVSQSAAIESPPFPSGTTGGHHHGIAQSIPVERAPCPTDVGLPQDTEEEVRIQPGYRAFRTDNGAFPSAMDTPSSPGVRTRAQEWESRLPKDNVGREAKHFLPTRSPSRLNSATAEWKSFLGKKVQAESAVAAGSQLCQGVTMDAEARNDYSGPNDSLFDFSVTDGSFDSRTQSPPNTRQQGQDARVQHNHDHVPGMGRPQHEGMTPHCHGVVMEQRGLGGCPDPSKEPQSAPTEISEHSDGSQINKPFLARLAGCAAPMMRKGSQQGTDALAHLTFLRPDPPEDKHGSSRFVPQYFCGRPEVILEEANEGDEGDNPIEGKTATERLERQSRKTAQVQAPQLSKIPRAGISAEARADTHSVISEEFGAKTAYLEALAMKTAVSKPHRSDSRRRERSSFASDASHPSKLQQKERWRDFLDRKWKTGGSPGKSRAGSETNASAAENYAAKKVDEMMAIMSRSKSTPRNWRADDGPEKSKTQFVENAIRAHTCDTAVLPGEFGQRLRGRSNSLVAAEQLASARVNAMMQALGNDNSMMEEGEI